MPFKDPSRRREYNRRYQRAWYRRNRKKHITYVKRSKARVRKEIRAWLTALKGELKCERCTENHPACLDFHHADPSRKEFTIAQMLRKGLSKARLMSEIAKCQILCSNCHRKLHGGTEVVAGWSSG